MSEGTERTKAKAEYDAMTARERMALGAHGEMLAERLLRELEGVEPKAALIGLGLAYATHGDRIGVSRGRLATGVITAGSLDREGDSDGE